MNGFMHSVTRDINCKTVIYIWSLVCLMITVWCINGINQRNKDYQAKNRSTEGCSKLKSPETRQVQERSTLEHLQVPKRDRTRCPEE